MGQFIVNKKQESDATIIEVKGNIDEDANFNTIEFGAGAKFILDLNDVATINSCGIREWIKWIRTAPAGSQLTYRHCPKVIIDQINMVAGFLPENARVESFYVPYYSDASGSEKMVLFSEGTHFKDRNVFPPEEVKDDTTGDAMEMDVIESKYFKFLLK